MGRALRRPLGLQPCINRHFRNLQLRFNYRSQMSQLTVTHPTGSDAAMVQLAQKNAMALGAGHCFIMFLGEGYYPVNVLNAIKMVPEVCRIFCATANPVEVVVAETDQGRGVLGVIDGFLRRGSRARMTSRGRRICFDSWATSCEQRKESPINLLRNVRSGSTGPFIACIRDARPRRNPRIRPKSAFSRFAPLHRPDLVGQLRVRARAVADRRVTVLRRAEKGLPGDALLARFPHSTERPYVRAGRRDVKGGREIIRCFVAGDYRLRLLPPLKTGIRCVIASSARACLEREV